MNRQAAQGTLPLGTRAVPPLVPIRTTGASRPMRFSWLRGGTLLTVMAILIGEAVFLAWVVQNPAVTPADEAVAAQPEPTPRPTQPAKLEFRVGDATKPASRSEAVWAGLLGGSNQTTPATATNQPPTAATTNVLTMTVPVVALASNVPVVTTAVTTVTAPTNVVSGATAKVDSVAHPPPGAANATPTIHRAVAAVITPVPATKVAAAIPSAIQASNTPAPAIRRPTPSAVIITNALPPHAPEPALLTIAPPPSNPPPTALPVPDVFGNGRLLRLRPVEDPAPQPPF